eukprot:FR739516.1.p1 GENE.FR739516.1~~FR739516.1.p1  ORF type:complete len:174 (+),score=11.21 FR739516.1:81-524(+)
MAPVFRDKIATVLPMVKPKLVVKEMQPSFELFGVDFILDVFKHPWLAEINRSPRTLETDRPMLHALLDIVMQEQKAPPTYKTDMKWERLHVPEAKHAAKTVDEEDPVSKRPNTAQIRKEEPALVACGQGQGQGSHGNSPAGTATNAA